MGSADQVRVILHPGRNRLESIGVLPTMVCTEQEFPTAGQGHAYVGLGTATVAAVQRSQA